MMGVRMANSAVNAIALFAAALLIGVGGFALWDSAQVYGAASPSRYAEYKPTPENGATAFTQLQSDYPDVVSWLTVYGTGIDYPVVQGSNDFEYLDRDARGRYSLSGSIFLGADFSPDFSDFSSIIYGHHMAHSAMFGDIPNFSSKDYFDAHPNGSLRIDGQDRDIEFFAFLHTDAYNSAVYRSKISGRQDRLDYVRTLMGLAVTTRADIPVSADDRIVLLSTCADGPTNSRDILVGRISDAPSPSAAPPGPG